MSAGFNEERAEKQLNDGIPVAEKILDSEEELVTFIDDVEKKLKDAELKDALLNIPLFAEMLKSYWKKEYTDIPVRSIAAVISALLYWLSPVDIIPDFIPVLGYIDDAAVVAVCIRLIKTDLDKYKAWKEQKKQDA